MAKTEVPVVTFQPDGKRVSLEPDKSLLELATSAGVGIEATCGGKGTCGACRVKVSGPAAVAGVDEVETLGALAEEGYRLACRTRPSGDVSVWVPEESRRHEQVILATGDRVLVPVASKALGRRGMLQDAVPLLGMAVDLGTTTVVAYLHDLTSGESLAVATAMNPQVAHGDDLISRLSFCGERTDGAAELGRVVRECINSLARQACREARVSPEQIVHCVLVGNTAMHHLFLGLDISGLSRAPFQPASCAALETPASGLGLDLAPDALVTTLPLKAGFVGADAVAAALAVGMDDIGEATLLADLGTNGELVLATPEAALCCSTAAGPAFEGGHITGGMRAAPGAVDRVEVSERNLRPRLSTIGGRKPLGICGSGLVSAVRALVDAGAIRSDGRFAEERMGSWLRRGPDGLEFVLATSADTATGRDLVLTRRDVSELQLAKGAVYAGIALMMEELGVRALSRVFLAGAFGNYLDPVDACGIGLFPGVTPDQIRGVGNAAGAGAIMALLNHAQEDRAARMAEHMRYFELAGAPRFQSAFSRGLQFPREVRAIAN